MTPIRHSKRLDKVPPFLFDELDKAKQKARASGKKVIDLAIGDPDLPTPSHIIESMRAAVTRPSNHQYPGYRGTAQLRRGIAAWFLRRYGVELDPETEILVLIGSKEGIGHLPFALIDPGDAVLVPDPGYPVYANTSILAGGEVRYFALREEESFLPRTEELSSLGKARLIFLNYPNNPTGAVAEKKELDKMVELAAATGAVICNDAAYNELTFDGFRSPSILECEGAMDCAIEIHSFSKTFNMTGWRIGFAVGNKDVLAALGRLKVNLDSSVFGAIQDAALSALSSNYDENLRAYEERRKLAFDWLSRLGCSFFRPKGSFYVWGRVPRDFSSVSFAVALLEKAGVSVAPGSGFGSNGEGWFRMALTRPGSEIAEGFQRISGLKLWTN